MHNSAKVKHFPKNFHCLYTIILPEPAAKQDYTQPVGGINMQVCFLEFLTH